MGVESLSTQHLDLLQRAEFDPRPVPADLSLTAGPVDGRRLTRIVTIGRVEKGHPLTNPSIPQVPHEDVLVGLHGYNVPLAFLVQGSPVGVAIHLGTWQPKNQAVNVTDTDAALGSALRALYPAVEFAPADPKLEPWSCAGLGLGIPTLKPPGTLDRALPLDRLIRALSGADWAMLVLAEPVPESVVTDMRKRVINLSRLAQAEAQNAGRPSPLAQHYTELLSLSLKHLTQGQTGGAWRTAVYLLADEATYTRLASVWRSIFNGDDSALEPLRAWAFPEVMRWAVKWAMPDAIGDLFHPYRYQSLLTSVQLAAYVHLPMLETPGFRVNAAPNFDSVPPRMPEGATLPLGTVLHGDRSTQSMYSTSLKSLTRHIFIAGVTGSGKTNTIFHLLKQAAALDIPFLVIEPAKTEYRVLLKDRDLAPRLRVFTLGNEMVSPFRLNPFEVLPGTPVSVHLDLLRSVFAASFGMWTPLPQILEQCLHRVYTERGWDLTTDTNPRLDSGSDRADAFPTLSDLVGTVDQVTRELGYEEKITDDMRASLHTRLNSLRTGGKGRMLDVQRSLPMEAFLQHPTIFELEGMGDDDDKAFMMGLLLIRLIEYRRAAGLVDGLQHVLVIEEAHRLLTNVASHGPQEEANPRGKAVETFANLLSEIRAYGQGVIVTDQVPVKLAPDVIKNTNLKIAHRVAAVDDRTVLAGAMAMEERQAHALATLLVGQAAVFSEGDDAPVLIQIPQVKGETGQRPPRDSDVKEQMDALRASPGYESFFLPLPIYAQLGLQAGQADDLARQIVEDQAFQRTFVRLVASTVADTDALDRMWGELMPVVQAKRPANLSEQQLMCALAARASQWFTRHVGSQAGWTYSAIAGLADVLVRMLLARATGNDLAAVRAEFQQLALQLYACLHPPFPGCERLCRSENGGYTCLHRYSAADLINVGAYSAAWEQAVQSDEAGGDDHLYETWQVCQAAGYLLSEFWHEDMEPDIEARVTRSAVQACLCFGQQMMMRTHADKHPRFVRSEIDRLIEEEYDEQGPSSNSGTATQGATATAPATTNET